VKPRLLYLFADNGDRAALADAQAVRDRFDIVHEGFDLFRFPGHTRILWLDTPRWIERLVQRSPVRMPRGPISPQAAPRNGRESRDPLPPHAK
jgi:hypothetical protein